MSGLSNRDEIDRAAAQLDAAAANGKISASAAGNAKSWLLRPAYRPYQPQLVRLVNEGQFAELDGLFWEVIPFGTGGRRGRMADLGSATINDRTIAESAHGMAVYLAQVKTQERGKTQTPGAAAGRAVIAYDSRNRSQQFARIAACTLAAHGLSVFLFDGHRSTPALSFAVRHLKCDIGAMISASHNPPSDNGFKAYWSNGAQVLPPHDKGIIACVVQADEIPTVDYDEAARRGSIQIVGEEIDRAYVSSVLKLGLSKARDVRALFTPLHGVGETSVFRMLREAGFSQTRILESQRAPDGNFPNVPAHLPNPELNSAFGPAIAEAQRTNADLVLASDPDADRLGVAARGNDGRFVQLSGNQVGALIVDYVLRKRADARTLSPEHFVCTTLVTTPMIRAASLPFGVKVIDDLLVGFKYIAQTMETHGPDKFVFGVEESLGYLAGSYCRDKDAAIAALYVSELAAELKQSGKTLLDGLDAIYEKVGYFLEAQRSEACQGPRGKEQIDSLMRTFRENPPRTLGGVPITKIRDYRDQVIREVPGGKAVGQLDTTKGDLLFLDSAEGPLQFSIAVRPSGTEPKIKFYFFAQARIGSQGSLADLKSRAAAAMTNLQNDLTTWVHATLGRAASA